MNIHPLLVHVPVAFLATYSIVELAAFLWPSLRQRAWVFSVNAFLLFVGVVGAVVAYVTGGMAEEVVEATNPNIAIVEVHEPFAMVATIVYLIIAAAYVVRVFDRKGWSNAVVGMVRPFMRIWNVKRYFAHLVLDTWLLPVFALGGFVAIVVTGALGAAITYGSDVDPFVSFIYHLVVSQ